MSITIAARPHVDAGAGAEVAHDAEVMSVLAANGELIRIPECGKPFLVCEMFSDKNPDIALHELPRDFRELFGMLEMRPRPAQIIQQCVVTRAANTKRLRMEFDGPAHLDCFGLYQLLRIHRLRGEAHGGLSVGDPSLPHTNAFFLFDGRGIEHCISLQIGRSRWYLAIEKPEASNRRWSEHDKLFVPDSAMKFRRQFGNS